MMGSAVLSRLAAVLVIAVAIAGCQPDELGSGPKHMRPLSAEMKGRINDLGMQISSPIMVRIFKDEDTLEVWKQKRNGRYALLKTYAICKWSGKLGPKVKEGDRQAPEGFYTIYPAQMNPNSDYHLSFNLGFPNPYDRALGRTGSHLMVHGACSSRGCYAMEDAQIQEIYSLARDSFRGGQRAFQVQAFPFRMTPENMAKYADNTHMSFWKMLKDGYDHFEVSKIPPKVDYCGRRYVFNAMSENEQSSFNASAACPSYKVPEDLAIAVASKQKQDNAKTEQLVAELAEDRAREERAKEREAMIAEALGMKKQADQPTATASATSAPTQAPAQAPAAVAAAAPATSGVPVAKPTSHMALSDEKKSDSGSFFSSIFGGDDKPAQPAPGAAPLATTQAAVQAPAQTPATGTATAAASSTATPAPAVDAAVAATAPAAPAAQPPAEESGSVFSRWLGINEDKPAAPVELMPTTEAAPPS